MLEQQPLRELFASLYDSTDPHTVDVAQRALGDRLVFGGPVRPAARRLAHR